jgi:PAS domain-containing protein
VKSGKSVSYENTLDIASGKRWFQVNYSPVFDANSKVVGIALVGLDITERKEIKEILQSSEQKYRLLAESSPEMIYMVDKDGFIQYANTVTLSSFNQNAEQFIGKHLTEIYPPDIANSHLAVIKEIFKSRQNFYREMEEKLPIGKL